MRRHLRSAILLTVGLVAAGLSAQGALGAQPQGPASPAASQNVTFARGVLTVDVRDMPLADVLSSIREQSGINIEVHSGGSVKVTQSFSGVGLDEGIRRLAPAYNVVLVYGTDESKPGTSRLVEVHVYETSSKSPVTAVVDPQQRSTQLSKVRELSRQAARQRDPGAILSLTGLLAGDPDPTIRRSAAEALAGVRGPEAVNALRGSLGDQDPTVRGRSLLSLGQMREEGSVGMVVQAATRDPDASVRRSAVWALSTLNSEEARRGLEAAASDADPLVQSAATGALKQRALRGKSN